jgi:hypothetical protein
MNIKGEVDVDDYLYLTMMQWAKLGIYFHGCLDVALFTPIQQCQYEYLRKITEVYRPTISLC